MDESTLVRASQEGDRTAFGCLIDQHYKSIYRLTYRYTGSHAEADDICQDVFLRAMERIGSLRDRESFKKWLLAIAANLSRTSLKNKKRINTMDSQNICEIADSRAREGIKGPFDTLSCKEKADVIHKQLQQMPEHMRLVTILILMEGLSQKDAAAILGCSEPSVSRHLGQARKWLKDKLRNLV